MYVNNDHLDLLKDSVLSVLEAELIFMSCSQSLSDDEIDQIFEYIIQSKDRPQILKELQEHDIAITGVKDGMPKTVYKDRVDH